MAEQAEQNNTILTENRAVTTFWSPNITLDERYYTQSQKLTDFNDFWYLESLESFTSTAYRFADHTSSRITTVIKNTSKCQ